MGFIKNLKTKTKKVLTKKQQHGIITKLLATSEQQTLKSSSKNALKENGL